MTKQRFGVTTQVSWRRVCHLLVTTAALGLGVLFPVQAAHGEMIMTVSINGQFSDSAGNIYHTNSQIPVDAAPHAVTFANMPLGNALVDFMAEYRRTDDLGNGHFSDVVEITYLSLFGTPFLGNQAILAFDGHDANGNMLPVDAVLDYYQANPIKAGFILHTTTFPSPFAQFGTRQGNPVPLTNGAPSSAYFVLNYSYSTITAIPEPSAFWLLGGAALALFACKRRRRPQEQAVGDNLETGARVAR